MEQQYGEMLERLESRSDDTGKELVENLINLGELSRQLSAAEQEIERTMSDLARREQSIDVQRQAGLKIGRASCRQRESIIVVSCSLETPVVIVIRIIL